MVWRGTRSVHAARPLSGAGSARTGSRWTSVGIRVAYTATTRALAVLETLVHLTRETIPVDAVLIPIEVPDELIGELTIPPKNWNEFPYREGARGAGDRWIRERSSLGLLVPSAILPGDRNLLINPAHPEFIKVLIHAPEPGAFDSRLFPA